MTCAHTWEVLRGGRRQRCRDCGETFPCRGGECPHVDCEIERGTPPPCGTCGKRLPPLRVDDKGNIDQEGRFYTSGRGPAVHHIDCARQAGLVQ